MTGANDIKKRLTSVLEKSAKKLQLSNYSLNINQNAIIGDGFLGEFFKVSIINNDTKEEIKLAVKKAPEGEKQRAEGWIEDVYHNEIWFYSEIYPSLEAFEKEHKISNIFISIPDYITSVSEIGKELIVLKDITADGFKLREKNLLLDEDHAGFIFKTYGHFHAISFCLREQNPQEFERLIKPLVNIWSKTMNGEGFSTYFSKTIEQAMDSLAPVKDIAVRREFQKYVENSKRIFLESSNYTGNYYGILHGDCWSNNMMFSYHQSSGNNPILKAMKLLDFQLVFSGTPVFDLSYFFYTGGSKELFDKLEQFLDIYYKSFSRVVKSLGSDPKKLLPRQILSQEWKKYSKMGMMLSIMLTQVKLISREDSIEMIEKSKEQTEQIVDIEQAIESLRFNRDIFKNRVRDILVHMYEINAL